MKPRVLIIVENAPYALDGRVRHEAEALASADWDVTVICPSDKLAGSAAGVSSVRVVTYPEAPRARGLAGYVLEYAWSVGWILVRVASEAARGVEVVHICNPPDVLFAPALLARVLSGAAVVFDHHDLTPELFEIKFGHSRLMWRVLLACERLTFATADLVLSTNESYRSVAVRRGGKRPACVYVVRNGPDGELSPSLPSHVESGSGSIYRVGYVGMMGTQDGIDVLVRAAYHVVNTEGRQDVRFQLIGDGPALASAKRLSVELGVAAYIDFSGEIRGPEMLSALSEAHVCVAPDPKTPYSDQSTMIKVMEYMALGRPVVQFDLLEGRRSARDASLYARDNDPRDFAHCIVQLVDDAGRREQMGLIGRQRISRELAWSQQAPVLLDAYSKALSVARKRQGRRVRALSVLRQMWGRRH